MNPEHRCEEEAARSHGVIHSTRARQLGMSAQAMSRRVASGRWRLLFPQVYFVGAGSITWKSRLMAACLWGGKAAASHRSAAQLHGLLTKQTAICITVAGRRNSAHGIEVHRGASGPGKVVWVDRIPTTSIERTIIDCCRGAGRSLAVELIERGIRGNRTNLRRLVRAAEDPATPPSRSFRWAMGNRFAHGVTDSDAEDLYLRIVGKDPVCRGPVHHHVVTRHGQHLAELDFSYLPELVDVEIDGDEHHTDPVSVLRDRRRDDALRDMGWVVLRFTYWELVQEPQRVLEKVRSTLMRRRSEARLDLGNPGWSR